MAQSVAVAIRNPADSKLSKSVTVAKYQEYEAAPNPKGIADFIQERFTERYILPMTGKNKHGFAMMAVSCLMIETLESFKQGWLDTNKKTEYAGKRRSLGEVAFHEFFQGNPLFKDFIGVEEDFWKGVRCGILHQGETTRGWHIVRKKQPLFLLNPATKTIDAGEFLSRIEVSLKLYYDELERSDWNSDVWQHLRDKMKQVCANCA